MVTKTQDDISFNCPACLGSLVADIKCAGISLSCPHCLKWIQVPFPDGYDFETEVRTSSSASEAVKSVLENELETTRQKLRKSRADVTALETELKAARAQADPLRAALDAATKRVAEAREESTRAQAELAAAITARDDAEVGRVIAEKAAQGAAALRSEIAELKRTRDAAAEKLESVSKAGEQAENALRAERERTAQLEGEMTEAQKRYKAVLATTQDELEKVRSTSGEALAGLQAALNAAVAGREEAEAAYALAEKTVAELQPLRGQLETAQAALTHTHDQLTASAAAREQTEAALKSEQDARAALQRDLDDAQKRYKSVLAAKQDEIDSFQAQIGHLSAEVEELRNSPVKQEIARASARVLELEAELSASRSERSSLVSIRQDQSQIIEQLYEERTSISREFDHVQDLRATLEKHVEELELTVEGLSAALTASQSGRQESAEKLAAEANEHSKTRQALEALQASHEAHLSERNSLREVFTALEKPLEEIRRALEAKSPAPTVPTPAA